VANHVAGNLSIACGGAVPTLAIARTNHAIKMSQNWPDLFAISAQFVRCQEFSRLCVLMNPCPAGLEIHPDLAGYRILPIGKTR
jgi:hypothetical protein